MHLAYFLYLMKVIKHGGLFFQYSYFLLKRNCNLASSPALRLGGAAEKLSSLCLQKWPTPSGTMVVTLNLWPHCPFWALDLGYHFMLTNCMSSYAINLTIWIHSSNASMCCLSDSNHWNLLLLSLCYTRPLWIGNFGHLLRRVAKWQHLYYRWVTV